MRVLGVVGWKNHGKTTLVVRLVEHFRGLGLRVSTIKHTHHPIELDRPGKDSDRHRAAGAEEVLLATPGGWALVHDLRGASEPNLHELLSRLAPVDLVLVEGFKWHRHAKIEVHRTERAPSERRTAEPARPLLAREDSDIFVIASDTPLPDAPVAVLALDDVPAIAALALKRITR